ncbi:MAG: TonB-dependent receptor plug domain-containing protein, partial [Acidobacteriota bacterium]
AQAPSTSEATSPETGGPEAEGDETEGDAFDDEIVVFGQQIDRSLQETHASVALTTGADLENDTQTDLFDIFERAANASVTQGGFGFSIRGISDTGVAGGGSGLLVDVNVDGASAVTSQGIRTGPLSTWDLEQVEIHRGPQSTQQGRNALAGAVYIRSVDPGFSPELKTRVDVGEYDESRLAVAANVPLVANRLAFRLSYENYENDGAWVNPTRGEDDTGQSLLRTTRAKLRYVPMDELDIVLSHSVTDNRLGNSHVDIGEWPDRRVNFSNEENREEGTTTSTNLRLTYTLGDRWTLRSETRAT